ncbi:MAG: hypothetical protein KTR31_31010 [Myxococcales bacterium]|nr:hypothetical protein [Myxococcales bacterium]
MLQVWLALSASAPAKDARIEHHQEAGVVDLEIGSPRGTITYPLHAGTLSSTGQTVYFIVSDASDDDLADDFGAIHAPELQDAPDAVRELAQLDDGAFVFDHDPGLVAHLDALGGLVAPVANPEYSPIKEFTWDGDTVLANINFVWWGNEPGQQLLIDEGGCDPLIRSNPPSPLFVGFGPTDGADCTDEAALDRYKGGQVVDIDLFGMTVTFKLHEATYDYPDDVPYYIVTEASKGPAAGFMGVPFVPKLGAVGRFGDNDAVARIAQFANGVPDLDGGPNRFQKGVVSYRGGSQGKYSPLWHITWVFFDCDEDGEFFDTDRNVGEGAVPTPGSGDRFDPTLPQTFDPFGMDDKGVSCPEVAAAVTGHSDGLVRDLNELTDLTEDGWVVQTEGPAGLRLNSPLQDPLIVNCPVPVTIRR